NNEDSYTQSIAISIYRTLSSQYLADKDIALARQKLGKALEISPDNPRLLSDLVSLEIIEENYDEASKLASQIEAILPDNTIANYLRGQIYAAQKQWPQAINQLELAWKSRPNDATAALPNFCLASAMSLSAKYWLDKVL
ncbi:MAG TPA: tetratricopeptide repeat protein, partial [Porticoccus sp.]|nr:tetratricopeptide repeat protein [Porticoccus sp.]